MVFQVDSEAIYWSWVRAIAAELVRQTPFRAQRCLNFLEILTICPRGPLPLPDSPTDHQRRRSRSELRCWLSDSHIQKNNNNFNIINNNNNNNNHNSIINNKNNNNNNNKNINLPIIDDHQRRARSELRCWSSSNSSDDDTVNDYRTIIPVLPQHQTITRTWGCSESSEGSDDSLTWNGNTISSSTTTIILSSDVAPTSEQRIQRYKEARRRENEARTKRVLEEDAKKRKAKFEEINNNSITKYEQLKLIKKHYYDNNDYKNNYDTVDSPNIKLPPIKPIDTSTLLQQKDHKNNHNNKQNINNNNKKNITIVRTDSGERRSRARERRNLRTEMKTLQDYKETQSKIELNNKNLIILNRSVNDNFEKKEKSICLSNKNSTNDSTVSINNISCEEDVAKLLERCQRVDHYVPVREKLTLFESLSRMGGRLARSTEDLGRSINKTPPKGKQRARSLHDLNRGNKPLPVREMCRLFEGGEHDNEHEISLKAKEQQQHQQLSKIDPPCVRASRRKKNYK